VAVGCASAPVAPTAPAQNPVKRTAGEPVSLDILGAQYTFPARLDLPNFEDRPSVYDLDAVDRITGCEVTMAFETIAEEAQLIKFTNEKVASEEAAFKAKGLDSKVTPEAFKLLGKDGRLLKRRTANPNDADDHYSIWRFGAFIPDQTLAIHGFVECKEEVLLRKTLDVVVAAINTQTHR
jgi:hypothetical protein